ncbi:MAG: dicarboxylate/amino acid:cation symporter [bacterium]
MKSFFSGLLPKVIAAIIFGVALGYVAPEYIVRIFATFNSLFSNFLGFSIPLIILGLIISGIAELGKTAGKLLILTVIFAYGSTLFSGFFTFFTGETILPMIIDTANTGLLSSTKEVSVSLKPYFTIGMPPLLDVMSALIIAFVVGIGISQIKGNVMKNAFTEFKEIIEKLISAVIIPFLPLFIFGIFLNMSYSGEAFELMSEFGKVIIFVILLSYVLLIIQFAVAGIISKRNPLVLLKNMLPAYMTAMGTSSSAATIPVTLEQTKINGVDSGIAEFCIPLCATIHLSGSTMKITGMSMAILMMQGVPLDFTTYIGFIFLLGITMVAAPGVPGGAIMAAVAILQSVLGFNEQSIALMIAVYIAIDSFGTACNVTGDGAIAVIINKISGFKSTPK